MRLPRMTTRRWMVAVAVMGLLMGGVVGGVRLKRRHDYFLNLVEFHLQLERQYVPWERAARNSLQQSDLTLNFLEAARHAESNDGVELGILRPAVEWERQSATRFAQAIAYHAAMARKYRRAARYPWLPVEPDPPEPR